MRTCKVIRYQELQGFNECFEVQMRDVDQILSNDDHPYLIKFLEHHRVYTYGRAFEEDHQLYSDEEISKQGIGQVNVSRGGSVTYHGPGQLVVYLHVHLRELSLSLGRMFRDLEDWVIALLAEYGIRGRRREGMTGVWVGKEKICAMGIAAKKFVTYHGISINLNPDIEDYKGIIPCGLEERDVTSLAKLLEKVPPRNECEERLLACAPEWLKFS